MPPPPCIIENSADLVMWLSQRYLEHRKLKHGREIDQSSQHSFRTKMQRNSLRSIFMSWVTQHQLSCWKQQRDFLGTLSS
jgi:hypothetical protein